MPNRKYLSDVCLPELYSVVYSHVEKLIADATSISFTTDIWSSSVSQVSMLSLTAQWLDKDFVLKKSVLHSQECRGSHTAEAIASAFEGMFETWTIPKENVHVVVRDNARNMAKATSEFGVPSLPCMALAVGRRVVGHFKHSPLACSRFEDIQKELNMPVKKLQQDVSTRWNSTYYMMQSLVEQKRVLSAYAADYELPTTLTATQWGIMEKMITLLKPFEQLTRDISSAEATAADVIPGVVSLTRLLAKMDESDKGVQTAKHTLLEAVSKRFNGVQTEPLYAIATMVDARYKDRYFDPDKKEEARNMLLKVVDEMASVGNDQQEDAAGASAGDPGQEDQDPPPKRARTGSLQDMYQEILTENDVAKQATTGETASQVHAYLGEATILKTACPFKYWSSTQVRFPALARVARGDMSCRRSAIINISTLISSIEKCPETFARASLYPYRISKAGLNMLTRCQAEDFKGHNILVTAIHPGWVRTDMGGEMAPLTTQDSVLGMLGVMSSLSSKDSGMLVDWKGNRIPW